MNSHNFCIAFRAAAKKGAKFWVRGPVALSSRTRSSSLMISSNRRLRQQLAHRVLSRFRWLVHASLSIEKVNSGFLASWTKGSNTRYDYGVGGLLLKVCCWLVGQELLKITGGTPPSGAATSSSMAELMLVPSTRLDRKNHFTSPIPFRPLGVGSQ